jgi:hypothetical protein
MERFNHYYFPQNAEEEDAQLRIGMFESQQTKQRFIGIQANATMNREKRSNNRVLEGHNVEGLTDEENLVLAKRKSLESQNGWNGSERLPVHQFANEWKGNEEIKQVIKQLYPSFSTVVTARGDGNCFFNSIIMAIVDACKKQYGLCNEFVSYFFHIGKINIFVAFLMRLKDDPGEELTDELILDGVRWLRELAARQCRKEPEPEFRANPNQLRTMGKEIFDDKEIKCVLMALPIRINIYNIRSIYGLSRIEYMYVNESILTVNLMYFPGHYNLLC